VKPSDPGHGESAVVGDTGQGKHLADVVFDRASDAGDLDPDGRVLARQLAGAGKRGHEAESKEGWAVVAERDLLQTGKV
jgi:hypothetical protein